MAQKHIIEPGKEINYWTTLEPVKVINSEGYNETRWKCRCRCGKERVVRTYDLVSGKSSACNCTRDRIGKRFKGYEGLSLTNYNKYKISAEERNITFEITIEEMWEQFLKQDKKCGLTGLPMVLSPHAPRKNTNKYIEQTASLDRIDSTKGYTKDNIMWIHKRLQNMKWDFSNEYFISLCNAVTRNQD